MRKLRALAAERASTQLVAERLNGRHWQDPRDQRSWHVTAQGVPRRITFRSMELLECWSTTAETFAPLKDVTEAELTKMLDRARETQLRRVAPR